MSPQFRRWLPALVILGACLPYEHVFPAGPQGGQTARGADDSRLAEIDADIDHLQQMAKRLDGDPDRPDYMMKLANAYSEKKDYFNDHINSLTERIAKAREAGNEELAALYEKKRDEYSDLAWASRYRSTRVLEVLVHNVDYATWPDLDEALYRYALELSDLGHEAASQAAYQRLINDFPNSPRTPSAYLAFADYYFDKGHFASAVRLYENVVGFEDRTLHAYALYRLGRSHMHPIGEAEARYDDSRKYFVEAIQATQESGRTRSEDEANELRRLSELGLEELERMAQSRGLSQ